MSIWTIEELDAQIAEWKAALAAVASGRDYTIGGQTVRHHSLPEIREQLRYLDEERATLLAAQARGSRLPGPLIVRGLVQR